MKYEIIYHECAYLIGKHIELYQNRYGKHSGGYWYNKKLEAYNNYPEGIKLAGKLRPLTKFEHYVYYGIEL